VSLHSPVFGDGIIARDEWRGVTLFDPGVDGPVSYGSTQFAPSLNGVAFTRLNPCRKTLFVRGDGFANSVIDRPDPASVPGACAFTMSVDAVIAPLPPGAPPGQPVRNALEEIGLQVLDVTGLHSYGWSAGILDEPPNVDLLVVTCDTKNTDSFHHPQDGLINKGYGPYTWSWDEQGFSCTGTPSDYGNARSDWPGCGIFIYHVNVMNYFFNRPYRDEQASAPGIKTIPGFLDPVEMIEDNLVENGRLDLVLHEGIFRPDLVGTDYRRGRETEDGNFNGRLDGDHLVAGSGPESPPWYERFWGDLATEPYKVGYDFSVFDRDGDGLVENPQVENPHLFLHQDPKNPDPGEYTPQQKFTHTVLHEIFHALGVKGHSADASCLMSEDSISWGRAGHVSPWAARQIWVHNTTEKRGAVRERQ